MSNALDYKPSEEDFIVILSELKIIVYGIPGSKEYTGLQFEACGVDSFSLTDRAREHLTYSGQFRESEDLNEFSDDLAKEIILIQEMTYRMKECAKLGSAHAAVADMKEEYFQEWTRK